jgi:hypothetical protein
MASSAFHETEFASKRWKRTVPAIAFFCICAIALFFAARLFDGRTTPRPAIINVAVPQFEIYSTFDSAYKDSLSLLGKPVANAVSVSPQKNGEMYQARMEHATYLWGHHKPGVLLMDDTTLEYPPDDTPDDDKTHYWQCDAWLRKHFHPKAGFGPPTGSLAYYEVNNPKARTLIGDRRWHCVEPRVMRQQFEHGEIVGPLREKGIPSWNRGVVITLLQDKTWKSLRTPPGDAPSCITPPESCP